MKHFVLIDDDEDEFDIFNSALQELQFECKCTFIKFPRHAMSVLSSMNPDAVFVDYNMPELNGIECIKKIRAMPGFEDTCIVLYSTGAADYLCDLAFGAGANHCVKKPESIPDLAKAINLISERLAEPKSQPDQ